MELPSTVDQNNPPEVFVFAISGIFDAWTAIPEETFSCDTREREDRACVAMGAFYATNLKSILDERAITHLIFSGVTTEVCVQTSMREANDRGYDCLLAEDATESYFPEHQHIGFEHILVLRGAQEDERGVHALGELTVNPPGTSHSVSSPEGCVVYAVWEKPPALKS